VELHPIEPNKKKPNINRPMIVRPGVEGIPGNKIGIPRALNAGNCSAGNGWVH
jgi:hypothetical protein